VKPYTIDPETGEMITAPSLGRVWSVTTLPAPSNLTFSDVTDNCVTLNWQDNSTGENHFWIQRAIGDGAFANFMPVGANITHFTATNLNENTTYRWRVVAGNSTAVSAPTIEQTQTTKLKAPEDVRVRLSTDGNTVYWQEKSSQESGYTIAWAVPNGVGGSQTAPANTTAVMLPDTVPGDAAITVQATNQTNSSAAAQPSHKSRYAYFDDFNAPVLGYASGTWTGGDTESYAQTSLGRQYFRGLFSQGSSVSLDLSNLPAHSGKTNGTTLNSFREKQTGRL
jgi:hypothetical protein